MPDEFKYDVFLSHSAKDKSVVRPLAERLRKDGLKVWFDEWVLKPGDSIPAKIEEGLEHSRVLVLCMSAHAFGSDWAQLESGTFRFRDPLNKERRFIPLRLDDAPIKNSLAQFLYIDWSLAARDQEYEKLLAICASQKEEIITPQVKSRALDAPIVLDYKASIYSYAFSSDGKRALSGATDKTIRLWNLESGRCVRVLEGHTAHILDLAWSANHSQVLSGASDGNVRVWNLEAGNCKKLLTGHKGPVTCAIWNVDETQILSGSDDDTLRLWDLETKDCLRVIEADSDRVMSVAWNADKQRALSGSRDNTVRLWNVETGNCLSIFEGHTHWVAKVMWGNDQRHALSASFDSTVRVWDAETGNCQHVLKGHTTPVLSLAWSVDQHLALSGSVDGTVCVWDIQLGTCLLTFNCPACDIRSLAWGIDQYKAFAGDLSGKIYVLDLADLVIQARANKVNRSASSTSLDQVQYTNAKVLLVGESGVGKTGLSKRLASNDWQPSDSTVGAWATQWKLEDGLPESRVCDNMEREIWLWDFGGQADQRLIHQLYMDETALAVLVFDGQKEDLFETLGQWDRDLTRAATNKNFTKVLAAGRVDAGGLRVSRSQIEAFKKERGYRDFLETSAKTNLGCEELKKAILDGIQWENIPWRSSPVLFKRLKEELIRLKDSDRVLMRFNELRDTLRLRLTGEVAQFKDEELKAVIGLLAGPGVVWVLKFGSWVLLQPERINAYAQAVIQTMQADELERGCLPEEQVLKGELKYHSSMARLEGDEERFVLLAMHQTLVERGLCLRQPTAKGNLLIFPSYYRRERAEQVRAPAVLVSYHFNGFLDEIYATLVVRLHHTEPFHQDQLWRYAADFKTNTGKQLGVKLTRKALGAGDLDVYFDASVAMEEKIIFSKYIHEHLLQHARDVERLRHYICPHCDTPVGNREVAMNRLKAWIERKATETTAPIGRFKASGEKMAMPTILCTQCEKRVLLWDDMEQCFASPEIQQRVRELQRQTASVLESESQERALIGEVISTVALAGQICREFKVSEFGIDMEIEFVNDTGEATRWRLCLQTKPGDSYDRARRADGTEVFTIKDQNHARYWMARPFPVLLIVRESDSEVQWMEIRDHLKRATENGKRPVNEFTFKGERFDVMSVRRWRDEMLKQDKASEADESKAKLAAWAGGGQIVTLAVVFTDIVSSTELGNQAGDTDWNKIRRKHFARGQTLVHEMDGFLIKTIGDSLMVVFRNAAVALDFATEFRRDTGDPIVKVRQVAHIGPVTLDEGDVFGRHVNLSARVAGKAEGGDIVVTDVLKKDVDSIGDAKHKALRWEPITGVSFKGFSETFDLWRLREP